MGSEESNCSIWVTNAESLFFVILRSAATKYLKSMLAKAHHFRFFTPLRCVQNDMR